MPNLNTLTNESLFAIVANLCTLAVVTLVLAILMRAIPRPTNGNARIALNYFMAFFLFTLAGYFAYGLRVWSPLASIAINNVAFVIAPWCVYAGYRYRLGEPFALPRSAGFWTHITVFLCLQVALTTVWDSYQTRVVVAFVSFGAQWALIAALIWAHRGRANRGDLIGMGAAVFSAVACLTLLPLTTVLAGSFAIYTTVLLFVLVTQQVTLQGGISTAYLYDAAARYQAEAITDPLTSLHNRRHFYDTGRQLFAAARRRGEAISLVLIDIDHFKTLNDQHGHEAGDTALSKLSAVLKSATRIEDLVARIGGDEFALVLPQTDLVHARLFAERMRLAICGIEIPAEPEPRALTACIGLTTVTAGYDLEATLRHADAALYRAKSNGRDQVQTALDSTTGALRRGTEKPTAGEPWA